MDTRNAKKLKEINLRVMNRVTKKMYPTTYEWCSYLRRDRTKVSKKKKLKLKKLKIKIKN